ncbi:hypothetical protein M902_3146 [Bacteriovorax sp. BAL6_X]|uniref:hypothetical protein n=1 Tax=Bacteriovorax sp. BAL6_X TaxID=1201290 RepID=UPI00038635E5|nr:hypothetical protein [Bacteriovorax sp. BAL6_X]EPZ50869.1 hypothetical protein M902_3146 [Bacteriovorax sp. BAL6_X]
MKAIDSLGLVRLTTSFALIFTFFNSSTFARPLMSSELELSRQLDSLREQSKEYISNISSRTNVKELPISKYLSFVILKNGCAPLEQTIEEIELQDDSFPDQSKGLQEKLKLCRKSTRALKEFDVSELDTSITQRLSEE